MSMDKLTQEDGSSMDMVKENIEKLKEVFPDVFTEGKVDFDALQATLGEYLETSEERYSFNWHGKAQARRIAQAPSTGTLRPCMEESVDWDNTQNLFIEGDNLEVLKLLQKSYHKKVKMIYIDPPYNTGKEFIYPDKFQENLDTYLKYTGQKDDKGHKFSTNTETMGRYHTNWLNMMYPRLKLARNLLRDDGVIFISIDDNEVTNLSKICDEIFGEENFLGRIAWKNATDNNPSNIAVEHEYVLVYCKNGCEVEAVWKSSVSDIKDVLVEIGNKLSKQHENADELQVAYTQWFREHKPQLWPLDRYKYIDHGGVYTGSQSVHNPGKEGYRYDVLHPETGMPCKEPLMGYRFPENTMKSLIADGKILYGASHDKIIELKVYAAEYQEKLPSVVELDGRLGSYDVRPLFPEYKKAFDNPKPVRFLTSFIPFLAKTSEDIVLDFFAGSCSTAHAVMDINVKDGESRKYIMVQLPEKCGEKTEPFKAGVSSIAELSKERIRRAAVKIKEEAIEYDGDLGFKVLKLDSSNIKPWDADFDNIQQSLEDSISNIKTERSEEDVLYEILLKYGLDLTLPIETRMIEGKKVFSIGLGALVICLDSNITLDVVEGIGKLKAELEPEVMRVVFKDNGFKDDVVKTNAIQILKRYDIEDVKSL